jgi:hypothetical protein
MKIRTQFGVEHEADHKGFGKCWVTLTQKNSADTSLSGAVKVNQPNINNLLILGIGLR